MSGAERLYTPELLALTLRLAGYPWDETLPLRGDARSKSCGSTLRLGLALGANSAIARVGMRVQACAVGQAAAAIFADAAIGRGLADIHRTHADMQRWLAEGGELPGWPGLGMIEPARTYPARHGAMMLPWEAALAALSSARPSG